MILDKITLYNFGLYANRQTISLTPASASKPVVLLGGLNGGGKTTFLDALQLCLFGPHAKLSNRGSLAYGEYLIRSIHRGVKTLEAAIEITFRHTSEGQEDSYNLHRSWYVVNDNCREAFKVWKNGVADSALAENWATQVEDFVPPNIAHLFLFDGEQIEAYASDKQSSELIGAAIQNLLGLDMVDQLEKDLLVFERRKRSDKKNDLALAEIKGAEKDLLDLRIRADELTQERASLQTHGIDRIERALEKVENTYRKLGGHLFDQRVELERCLCEAETAVIESENALRETAGGVLPLVMVEALIESAHTRDRHEEDCRRAREVVDVLQARDRAALKKLRSQSVSEDVLETMRQFFKADRSGRRELGKKETLLGLSPEIRSDFHNILRGDLANALANAKQELKRHKEHEARVERARVEFESIPSADTISEVIGERNELKGELGKLKAQHAALSRVIVRTQREIDRKGQALTRLHEAEAKAMNDRDDRTRILRHAAKVRGTLKAYRRAVVERHVRRIEQLVLESYKQLLRKASLVTRLSIDPQQFSITLYGDEGRVLTTERLSAGERQLLGIALLWGLAKASGRPLPTAIDTPLGRLDAGHRMHLVERYLPFASHQVLLLSTDEEIAGDYFDRLKPWIGKTYYLNYDDSKGKTQIVPGYFRGMEAA